MCDRTKTILALYQVATYPLDANDIYINMDDLGYYRGEIEAKAKSDIRERIECLEKNGSLRFKRKSDDRLGWVAIYFEDRTDLVKVVITMERRDAIQSHLILKTISPILAAEIAVHIDRLYAAMKNELEDEI